MRVRARPCVCVRVHARACAFMRAVSRARARVRRLDPHLRGGVLLLLVQLRTRCEQHRLERRKLKSDRSLKVFLICVVLEGVPADLAVISLPRVRRGRVHACKGGDAHSILRMTGMFKGCEKCAVGSLS
eukprot:4811137-Pleurochrysis_carterae.AAC.2